MDYLFNGSIKRRVGSKLNTKTPARPLLIIIALVLIVSGFLLIFKG